MGFSRWFQRPQRQLADRQHSEERWQRWVLRRVLKTKKSLAVWIFVKELSSKVKCSMGDRMMASHWLKISLKSGDAEKVCFGAINDLVHPELSIFRRTLAHYPLYSRSNCEYLELPAKLLENINSEKQILKFVVLQWFSMLASNSTNVSATALCFQLVIFFGWTTDFIFSHRLVVLFVVLFIYWFIYIFIVIGCFYSAKLWKWVGLDSCSTSVVFGMLIDI